MAEKVVLTGVKPTGKVHIGNYIGAIRPALNHAAHFSKSLFFIADYHALTSIPDPKELKELTYDVAASWIAAGLDTSKTTIYRQSDVHEVFEIFWVLSCFSAKGLMNRAHAYKARVQENEAEGKSDLDAGVNMGLYNYPILMASDILSFDTDLVPVGEDQIQHLEIARDLAQKVNHTYKKPVLKVPEFSVQKDAKTVPGLDGRKMSKSYDNTIPMFADSKALRKLVMKIKTDSLPPDADGFIRSASDTLLSIEYHRHFTHSIFFIPIGAFIPALIVWLILRRKEKFWPIYGFAFLGFATHGILDACTSYGTRLFIPFSYERIAWDNVAIIDPFFTLPLLIAMIWVLKTKNTMVVRTVMAICVCYLYFGIIQRDRAIDTVKIFVEKEGKIASDIQAKPTIGQLFLWKVIYLTNNQDTAHYNVRAVRLGLPPFFDTKIYEGESAPALDIKKRYADLDPNSRLYRDILRFEDFSSRMLILMPEDENTIGDVRYSLLPTQIKPLWGITVDTTKPEEHAVFKGFRDVGKREWATYWSMINGTYPAIGP